MKLFTRYNRINLFVMVFIFLLSGLAYYILIRHILIHELDEALEAYKNRIAVYVASKQRLPAKNEMEETYLAYLPVRTAEPARFALTDHYEREERHLHRYRELSYTQLVGSQYYRITIARALEGTRLLTATIVGITLILLLTVILVSLLLNMVLLRKLWQPFYETVGQLKQFKLGRREKLPVATTDIDEFILLNETLTAATEKADADYRVLKEFTENAAHEMQTPLAIVRSKLDLVIQQEGLSTGQTDAIQSAYSGLKRLYKLNQSLLLLAKIENRQFHEREHIDLEEKISDKLDQFRELWESSGIHLEQQIGASSLYANGELTDVLLNNLFSNALRHNNASGKISVVLTAKELIIANTGAAAALDPQLLFQRFYKGGQQHSRHNGLGLSIVKQICDQSGIGIRYAFTGGMHRFMLSW